jgi:translation initiation factor 1 (eIF-1/SUI1)
VRTIKLFAVIGLAVALVAVPALAASVTVKISATQNRQSGVLAIQVDSANAVCVPVSDETPSQIATKMANALGGRAKASEDQITIQADSRIQIGTSPPPGQPCTLQNPQTLFAAGQTGVGARVTILGLTFEVVSLPTLTEWGLIALAVLLAGGMGYMIYRRRPALRPAAP